MDKEYIVLNEIEKNSKITQRELSKKTELSLGSVNILLNKMAREGLIKIKQIPMNRVAYMLTPMGITEKIKKTGAYIKYHYNYISNTKSKIIEVIENILSQGDKQIVQILMGQDEISELVKAAVQDDTRVVFIYNINDINRQQKIVVLNQSQYEELRGYGIKAVNLLELIG